MKSKSNDDGNLKESGPKRTNLVEDIAKNNNSIDDQTAAINKEQKVVDINYVLTNNPEISFKINNILKLGIIGMDYIEKLIAMQSNFTVGDDVKVLEDELDKICTRLVHEISEEDNGIVLNDDGTVNIAKSNAQKERILSYGDVIAHSHVLSNAKNEQNGDKLKRISDKDIKKFMNQKGEYIIGPSKSNRKELKLSNISFNSTIWKNKFTKFSADYSKKNIRFLERKIKLFEKEDIEEINDPNIAAIYYKMKLDQFKDDPKFDLNTLENEFAQNYPEQKKMGIMGTYNDLRKKFNENKGNVSIESIIGESVQQTVLKKYEDRVNKITEKDFDSIEANVKYIDQENIDEIDDVNINAIWYHKKIEELNSMGYKNDAQKLKIKFENKFKEIKIENKIQEIKENISQQIKNPSENSNNLDIKNIQKTILGDNGNIFVQSFKWVSRRDKVQQYRNSKKILNHFCNSIKDKENVQQQLSNLYSKFYEMRDYNGTEIIKKFICDYQENFGNFIDSKGNFSSEKILHFSDSNNDKTNSLYKKMQKEMQKTSEAGKKDKGNAKIVYSYITSDRIYTGKEKDIVENAMHSLISKKNVYSEIKNAVMKKDNQIFENANKKANRDRKDTWRNISTTVLKKGIKAITNLPRVLTGKEEISLYLYKVSNSFNDINSRVANKIKNSVRLMIKAHKNKEKELIASEEVKKLPSGIKAKNFEKKKVQNRVNVSEPNLHVVDFNESIKIPNDYGQVEKAALKIYNIGSKDTDTRSILDEQEVGQ